MKDIKTIAREINAAAKNYAMGQFQEIRHQIHGCRLNNRNIFAAQTVHDDWAFHWGGRTELQFNIGFEGDEREWFRYGVAFSLESSRSLTEPLILKPKVLKLNRYLTDNSTEFEDLRFWYFYPKGVSSKKFAIGPIPEDIIRVGAFLFWGKLTPRETIQADEVLFLFDRMLSLYRYVEGDELIGKVHTDLRKGFVFKAGCVDRPESAVGYSRERTHAISLRHNTLQAAVHTALCAKFGGENVGTENDTGRGSRVDLVVREGNDYLYYEIKTYPCIRTCLREAVAQLMEYSYWPGGNIAKRMAVVSENELTPDARRYLLALRTDFHLPVYYQRLDQGTGSLDEPQ